MDPAVPGVLPFPILNERRIGQKQDVVEIHQGVGLLVFVVSAGDFLGLAPSFHIGDIGFLNHHLNRVPGFLLVHPGGNLTDVACGYPLVLPLDVGVVLGEPEGVHDVLLVQLVDDAR